MKKLSVRLTRAAEAAKTSPEGLREAAAAAFSAAGGGEIRFLAFEYRGKQYALSSRHIIEVDLFPNRVPNRVIREGSRARRG